MSQFSTQDAYVYSKALFRGWRYGEVSNSVLVDMVSIQVLLQVPTAPLSIQLPTNVSGQTLEDGPSAGGLAPT